jgi:hypothetical protein
MLSIEKPHLTQEQETFLQIDISAPELDCQFFFHIDGRQHIEQSISYNVGLLRTSQVVLFLFACFVI